MGERFTQFFTKNCGGGGHAFSEVTKSDGFFLGGGQGIFRRGGKDTCYILLWICLLWTWSKDRRVVSFLTRAIAVILYYMK